MALPTPKGRQREVLYLPAEGHIAVLGTAGSGKTTLAILRSAYLADRAAAHYGPTLLLTFNNTLIAYLNHWMPSLAPDVRVETYHKFARGYLHYRGKMRWRSICDGDLRDQLIAEAIALVHTRYPTHPILGRQLKFFSEEIKWISQQGIASMLEYEEANRVGRAIPVDSKQREIIYRVLEVYGGYGARGVWITTGTISRHRSFPNWRMTIRLDGTATL